MRVQTEILSWEVSDEAKWKFDMKAEQPSETQHHFLELVYKRAVGLQIHKGAVQKTGSPGPSPWDRDSFQGRSLFSSRRKQDLSMKQGCCKTGQLWAERSETASGPVWNTLWGLLDTLRY